MITSPIPTVLIDPEWGADQLFEEITLNGKKWDDPQVQTILAMVKRVAFNNPQQRKEDNHIVMKPKDRCLLPGGAGWNYREFFNILIADAQASASPDDQVKMEQWKLFDYPAGENKFGLRELRGLREFGEWLILNDSPVRTRFFNRHVWSLGDLKLLGDFGKAHTAQNNVQSASRNVTEYDKKDRGNFSPYGGPGGGGKDPRSTIVDYADKARKNAEKLDELREAQKSARTPKDHEDLQKTAGSTKKGTTSFIAEDEAIDNPAFEWDLAHGDLSEYVRMSDNFDGKDWIKIPDGLTPSLLEHVEDRVSKLESEQSTLDVVETLRLSNRASDRKSAHEIAVLRECYFRPKKRVDTVSKDLGIDPNDAWDYLNDGPKLAALIMTPTKDQRKEAVVQGAERFLIGSSELRMDLPGKMFDARVVTLAAFGMFWGLGMLTGMFLLQDSLVGPTFVLAVIGAFVFNATIGHSSNFNPQLFRRLMLALPILLLVLILANNYNGARIQNEINQRGIEMNRYLMNK